MAKISETKIWLGRQHDNEQPLTDRWHNKVCRYQEALAPGVCLIGFPCDLGVRKNKGRHGAAKGPEAIRRALANIAWHINRPVYDVGNLDCEWNELHRAQKHLGNLIDTVLSEGHFPLVLGGGHEMSFGGFQGLLKQKKPAESIGILNFDAHLDLGEPISGGTSETQFYQVAQTCHWASTAFHYLCLGVSKTSNTQAQFAKAKELGAQYKLDSDINWFNLEHLKACINTFINAVDTLYISIDLDVLPAHVAPGVSSPTPFGVPLDLLEYLLQHSKDKAGSKLRLADIAEYNPNFDQDKRTANVSARLVNLLAS